MPTILGVNVGREFFGGPETLEKQGHKFRWKNSLEEFAEKFGWQFSQNSPDQNKNVNPNPLLSAEPRDQNFRL